MTIAADIGLENIYRANGTSQQISIDITGVSNGNKVLIVLCMGGAEKAATDAGSDSFSDADFATEWLRGQGLVYHIFYKVSDGTETTITFDGNVLNDGSWFAVAYETSGGLLTASNISMSGLVMTGTNSYLNIPLRTYDPGGLAITIGGFGDATGVNWSGTVNWLSTTANERPTIGNYTAPDATTLFCDMYQYVQGPENTDEDHRGAFRLNTSASINSFTHSNIANIIWKYDSYMAMTDNMAETVTAGENVITSGTLTDASVGKVYTYVKTSSSSPSTAAMESGAGSVYHGYTDLVASESAVDHAISPPGLIIGGDNYYAHAMHFAYGNPGARRKVPFTAAGVTVQGTTEALEFAGTDATITIVYLPTDITNVTPDNFEDTDTGIVVDVLVSPGDDLSAAKLFIGRVEQTITGRTATTLTFTVVQGTNPTGANAICLTEHR